MSTDLVKIALLFEHPNDPAAFDAHYRDVHVPLVRRIPDLVRYEVSHFAPGSDGAPAPYYCMAELWFADAATMRAALSTPEAAATTADVREFAGGRYTFLSAAVAVHG